MTETEGEPRYLPTKEEIAAACAKIRRGWSSTVRRARGRWMFEAGDTTPQDTATGQRRKGLPANI